MLFRSTKRDFKKSPEPEGLPKGKITEHDEKNRFVVVWHLARREHSFFISPAEGNTFSVSPSKRKGKIYLDYLQNAKGKTMSSVYSLRPRPGAPVSAPVHWDEQKNRLTPDKFTLKNIRKRLEKEGDIWQGIFNHLMDLDKVLEIMKNKNK